MLIAALSWHPFRAVLSTGNILPCWEFFYKSKKWSHFNSSFCFYLSKHLEHTHHPHVCKPEMRELSHKGLVCKSLRAWSSPCQTGPSAAALGGKGLCSKGGWIGGLSIQLLWLSFSSTTQVTSLCLGLQAEQKQQFLSKPWHHEYSQ